MPNDQSTKTYGTVAAPSKSVGVICDIAVAEIAVISQDAGNTSTLRLNLKKNLIYTSKIL